MGGFATAAWSASSIPASNTVMSCSAAKASWLWPKECKTPYGRSAARRAPQSRPGCARRPDPAARRSLRPLRHPADARAPTSPICPPTAISSARTSPRPTLTEDRRKAAQGQYGLFTHWPLSAERDHCRRQSGSNGCRGFAWFCVMVNGLGLRRICPARLAIQAAAEPIIVCLLKRFFGWPERARRGAIFQSFSAIGQCVRPFLAMVEGWRLGPAVRRHGG